jgi:hypothetical protein
LTQPLKETSSSNIFWVIKAADDKITTFMCRLSGNM